jgi:hypothetical protein
LEMGRKPAAGHRTPRNSALLPGRYSNKATIESQWYFAVEGRRRGDRWIQQKGRKI